MTIISSIAVKPLFPPFDVPLVDVPFVDVPLIGAPLSAPARAFGAGGPVDRAIGLSSDTA
jgi:hypothetical protein